jgi:hypothetical protein
MSSILSARFSYFQGPITNLVPYKSIGIGDAYNLISGSYLADKTSLLRAENDPDIKARLKRSLPYATFAGVFRYRADAALEHRSNLFCADLDHLGDRFDSVRNKVISTRPILIFRSPSSEGLKVVYKIDGNIAISAVFQAFKRYFSEVVGANIDEACKNVSRACFLCHDQNAHFDPSGCRMYGADFVDQWKPKKDFTPILTKSTPHPQYGLAEKMATWVDRSMTYQHGTRHLYAVKLIGALRRNGVPQQAALDFTLSHCKAKGDPLPDAEICGIVSRMYALYHDSSQKQLL